MQKLKRNNIAQKIYDFAAPIIQEMGFDLVDTEYQKENGKLFLRLFIDKRHGVSIDECALVNERLDNLIETELNLHDHDYFEVSSPGLDRPLTEQADFDRYQGLPVNIKLYSKLNGKKLYSGILYAADQENLQIQIEDSQQIMQFALKDIAKITRQIRFD